MSVSGNVFKLSCWTLAPPTHLTQTPPDFTCACVFSVLRNSSTHAQWPLHHHSLDTEPIVMIPRTLLLPPRGDVFNSHIVGHITYHLPVWVPTCGFLFYINYLSLTVRVCQMNKALVPNTLKHWNYYYRWKPEGVGLRRVASHHGCNHMQWNRPWIYAGTRKWCFHSGHSPSQRNWKNFLLMPIYQA